MNIDAGESGCMVDTGWTFHKDYVQTVFVNDDSDYLGLTLDIGGFHGNASVAETEREIAAELSFDFETNCSHHRCQLALLMVRCTQSVYFTV